MGEGGHLRPRGQHVCKTLNDREHGVKGWKMFNIAA